MQRFLRMRNTPCVRISTGIGYWAWDARKPWSVTQANITKHVLIEIQSRDVIVTEQFSGQSRQCVVSWWNPGSLSSACSRGFFDKILTDGRLNAVCAHFPRWMQGEGCPKANGKPKTRRAILLTYAGFNQPQIAAMCKLTKF